MFDLKRTWGWGGGEGEWVISAARKQFISAQIKLNSVIVVAVFAVRGPGEAAGESVRRGMPG